MSEIIRISNFGGIKEMEMELKPINVIIGPQASGKSVTAKLLYFFKGFFGEIFESIENGSTKRQLDNRQTEKFYNYFPKDSWPEDQFKIEYYNGQSSLSVERKTETRVAFSYSNNIRKLFEKCSKYFKDQIKIETNPSTSTFQNSLKARINLRTFFQDLLDKEIEEKSSINQLFIPAGRSFYTNIQSGIFSFLSDNRSLDPFLVEFGSFYEDLRRYRTLEVVESKKQPMMDFDLLINEVLNGRYLREKEKDFLVHDDSRKVNILNASSGQQETLPLVLVLKALVHNKTRPIGSLYIEEPEAHLFPVAQKRIVQLLVRTFNARISDLQIIITTHSPYILASLNNLMEAGKILQKDNSLINGIFEIVNQEEIVFPQNVAAYSLSDGKKENIIDEDTELIAQNVIDTASDEIALQFDKLLDLEF